MAGKYRVIQNGAVLFRSADMSELLVELPRGTELELGEAVNLRGKRSVAVLMPDGQSGFIHHQVSVWQIREAVLAQLMADLHEQPLKTSAVKKKYIKGARFLTHDLVDGSDGKWMKITGSEGETGYLHGDTKVLFQAAKTLNKNAFLCRVPDRPAGRLEQLFAGSAPGGTFRDIYRSAEAAFDSGEFVVRGKRNDVDGGTDAIVAKTAVKDIEEIIVSVVPVQARHRAAVIRSLLMSGGFAFIIFIGIAFSSSGDERNLLTAVGYSLFFGLGSGFLFSFLPGLFMSPGELTQLSITKHDGSKIVLVIDEILREEVFNIIRTQGIRISEK